MKPNIISYNPCFTEAFFTAPPEEKSQASYPIPTTASDVPTFYSRPESSEFLKALNDMLSTIANWIRDNTPIKDERDTDSVNEQIAHLKRFQERFTNPNGQYRVASAYTLYTETLPKISKIANFLKRITENKKATTFSIEEIIGLIRELALNLDVCDGGVDDNAKVMIRDANIDGPLYLSNLRESELTKLVSIHIGEAYVIDAQRPLDQQYFPPVENNKSYYMDWEKHFGIVLLNRSSKKFGISPNDHDHYANNVLEPAMQRIETNQVSSRYPQVEGMLAIYPEFIVKAERYFENINNYVEAIYENLIPSALQKFKEPFKKNSLEEILNAPGEFQSNTRSLVDHIDDILGDRLTVEVNKRKLEIHDLVQVIETESGDYIAVDYPEDVLKIDIKVSILRRLMQAYHVSSPSWSTEKNDTLYLCKDNLELSFVELPTQHSRQSLIRYLYEQALALTPEEKNYQANLKEFCQFVDEVGAMPLVIKAFGHKLSWGILSALASVNRDAFNIGLASVPTSKHAPVLHSILAAQTQKSFDIDLKNQIQLLAINVNSAAIINIAKNTHLKNAFHLSDASENYNNFIFTVFVLNKLKGNDLLRFVSYCSEEYFTQLLGRYPVLRQRIINATVDIKQDDFNQIFQESQGQIFTNLTRVDLPGFDDTLQSLLNGIENDILIKITPDPELLFTFTQLLSLKKLQAILIGVFSTISKIHEGASTHAIEDFLKTLNTHYDKLAPARLIFLLKSLPVINHSVFQTETQKLIENLFEQACQTNQFDAVYYAGINFKLKNRFRILSTTQELLDTEILPESKHDITLQKANEFITITACLLKKPTVPLEQFINYIDHFPLPYLALIFTGTYPNSRPNFPRLNFLDDFIKFLNNPELCDSATASLSQKKFSYLISKINNEKVLRAYLSSVSSDMGNDKYRVLIQENINKLPNKLVCSILIRMPFVFMKDPLLPDFQTIKDENLKYLIGFFNEPEVLYKENPKKFLNQLQQLIPQDLQRIHDHIKWIELITPYLKFIPKGQVADIDIVRSLIGRINISLADLMSGKEKLHYQEKAFKAWDNIVSPAHIEHYDCALIFERYQKLPYRNDNDDRKIENFNMLRRSSAAATTPYFLTHTTFMKTLEECERFIPKQSSQTFFKDETEAHYKIYCELLARPALPLQAYVLLFCLFQSDKTQLPFIVAKELGYRNLVEAKKHVSELIKNAIQLYVENQPSSQCYFTSDSIDKELIKPLSKLINSHVPANSEKYTQLLHPLSNTRQNRPSR